MTYLQVSPVFPQSHCPRSSCLPNVVPATFAGHTLHTVLSFLWSTYWPSSHMWISQGVPRFENTFFIGSARYTFELFRHLLYSVILSALDPRKCEYLKDYSLEFEHAYMTTYLAS